MRYRIKLLDFLIIAIVSAFVFFSAYIAYMRPAGNLLFLIRGNEGEWVFPAETNESVIVRGPLGDTVVRLEENCAWIESSPCDNKTCAASGKVAKQGQWAACLPNGVLLMISGSGGDGVDSVSW